jgi:hypothetical protein
MKTTLLTLAVVAAAGTAGAQTPSTPATGDAEAGATMNSPMGAGGSAAVNPDLAGAPAPRLGGAAGTAQRRIEQDGYKQVGNLQKGDDGLWHGTALRGNAKVQVTVDRSGLVSAQ